ncbi:histo-blood group ABO system transferase 2-like [Trachemys scripta elegans]|uniref:histo-blood group ABO system transferase 2-like n=1 Tax=Trachemys scripta elegans TaxID=31138 RepID=UPI0015538DFA|nr:histo-blood group ABO system transferase 2-like [Trachemys scripta elegans]
MAYDRYVTICKPLHYERVMNRTACVQIAASAWISGLLNSALHTESTFVITFCGGNMVDQFFCEIPQLLKLACYDSNHSEVLIPRQADLDETFSVLPRMSYPQPFVDRPQRTDVLLMSPWLAPIVWEGTFNRDILNAQYRQKNSVVGVATFAVKKYVRFIEGFLGSANKFFLSGHRVNFYLFTDHPEKVPSMKLAPEKRLFVIPVQNYPRWQDISMNRMDIISSHIRSCWRYEVDYLYSMDIDVQLFEHIGVEIIDTLVGTISSWQYTEPRENNSYERRQESRAAIPIGEGDFYYAASFYGGSVSEVYKLTTACYKGITEDRASGIEAKWHEESHLNKYLLYHKPTRLLSPEYYWDEELIRPLIVKVKRLSSVHKDLKEVRF